MNRSIPLAAAIAGGGLLAAAFLQAAVGTATPDSAPDAGFTIGDLSFNDPVALPGFLGGEPTPGYESIIPTFANAPLLSIGSDTLTGLPLHTGVQQFTLEDSAGTTLGTVETSANVQNLLGITTTQFTVSGTDPASGLTDSQLAQLPADGTVYSITNLGGGFANVYQAIPNADGTAASTITNTFVTPFGNFDVPVSYDAIAPLDPAGPLEALGVAPSATGLSANAFTIDGTTFDPGSDGITIAQPLSLSSFAPLLEFNASAINVALTGPSGTSAAHDFEVYTNGTDAGSVQTYLWYSNLLGIHSTQFTVGGVTPTGDASDLPAIGTVYSVTDLGGGYQNIYEAVPGTGGGSATITDTFVTPFGNFDVPTSFDATVPLDPAAPLGALAAAASNANLSDNAFTVAGITFDPGSDGFSTDHTYALFGIAPLLEISGVNVVGVFVPSQNGVEVYDSSGVNLGSVNLGEQMSNILGFINTTQFTVTSVDAATGLTATQAAELPALGTVYSITDLGMGLTNVYEAIPNADGTAASSITDTLITPFGNMDLSSMFSMFDAVAALSPGDAAAGIGAGTSAAAAGFDLFDPVTWF